MKNKLNFKQIMKAAGIAAGLAAVLNAVLFFVLHTSGVFTDNILIQPGMPLTVVPVLLSSIIPTLLAGGVFFLLERFTSKGFLIFGIISIVLLLLSFANPYKIPGVTTSYALGLNLMHLVVAGFILYFIRRAKLQINNA